MELEQKSEFMKLMTGVAELYGKGVSPYLFEIYWQSLEKYSLDEVRRAINLHIVNPDVGQFMPKPADFVRYIEGRSQERALFAWEKVISAMRIVGAYDSIIFDDLLIHHVIEKMGGWIMLCHTPESKLPFSFQDFSRHYLACLAHEISVSQNKLTGITEHLNGLYGQTIPEPTFFDGNEKISHVKTLEKNSNDNDHQNEIQNEKSTEINCVENNVEKKSHS